MKKILLLLTPFFSFIIGQNPLSVSPESIDFGLVNQGETASLEISLENSSNQLLTVNIESSSAYIYSSFPSVNIPANGSSDITLNYSPSLSGVSNATISFVLNFEEQEYTTSIECIGSSYSTISGGDVSGIWDTTMSPIIVEDDITVPEGETLTIDLSNTCVKKLVSK